jgi:hypothetical protein
MDMPMNSRIGKIGKSRKNLENSLNQSINVRIINDKGLLL